MRSIHKKTLKRFLSTLLAVVMVLGMVPFTALAAPVTDSVTLTQGNLTAKVSPHNVYFSAANKGANAQYGLRVDITASGAVDVNNVVFEINGSGSTRGLATKLVANASDEFTTVTNFSVPNQGFEGYHQSTDNKTLTYYIKVESTDADALKPGYHEVNVRLNSSGGDTSGTIGFTIPQYAQVTGLTFSNDNPAVGETFTVYADTDISSGTVKFTYGTQVVPVNIVSMGGGKGRAYYIFTATTVREVTAEIVDFPSGAVPGTASTKTESLTALSAAPAYSYTVSYSAGTSVIASNIPADDTVTGDTTPISYTLPTAVPLREGYAFAGWSTDGTETGKITTTEINVGENITLTALWTKNTVTLTWPNVSAADDGIESITKLDDSTLDTTAAEGSTVTFKVKVTDGYDVSNMVVTAGGVALAPVATVTANEYQYSFVANANTLIFVSPLQPIPVYHSITFLPGAVDAYIPFSPTTVSVKDGKSYTLPTAIPTREGYTFKGWDSDGDSDTVEYAASATSIPAADITGDMTLNAVWEVEKVAVTLASGTPPTGVTLNSSPEGMKDKGSTVYFTLTVAAGYDPSTMVVTANGVALAAVKSATSSNMYQYSFVADAATEVEVSAPTKYQYTVTLPTGDHFTAKFDSGADSDTVDKVEHGSDSTKFTITPASDWTVDAVYANGEKLTAGADNKYQVINVTANTVVTISMKETVWRTVTYFLDGAGMYAQVQVADGTSPTLLAVPSVKGYTVSGWYTGPDYGTQYTAAAVTKDLSLYAKKEAKTFDITFNMNAGADTTTPASIDKVVKTYGQAAQLRSTVPTRTGYTFLGWGTSASAKTPSYQPGDTFSAEITSNVTLYAVWQIDTFTVTLPNGTGYTAMPAAGSSSPVDYKGSFKFTVTVDPEYAVATPVVKANNVPLTTADTSSPYTYTISNIQENKVVSVSVTKNPVHTVTFQYTIGSETTTYQTQQVEHGAKATVPNPPTVEGYTFDGWYVNLSDATAYNFGTSVTANLTLNAKMTAITPTVTWTASGTGWSMAVTESTPTGLTSGGNVTYKSSVEFTVTIAAGYDATNLAVAANGLALAPVEVNGNTYKFVLPNITADQKITVTGVARKMVTITYNDNGGIGGPGQEQVPMYVATLSDNGTITSATPSRVGYTFAKWNTKADGSGTSYNAGAANTFTTDTTLYAVWSAKATTVTLEVSNTTLTDAEYEGEDVTLTADVKSGTTAVTSGSVQFYRYTKNPDNATEYADENNWKLLDSKVLSGGKATLTIATSDYVRAGQNKDSYKAVFVPDEGAGYSTSNSAGTKVTVTVLSTAISWELNSSTDPDSVAAKANELTIKDSNGNPATSMIAGQEYTLELPKIYALDDQTTALVVNKDYTVIWQYLDGANGWQTYTEAQEGNTVKILPDFAKYQFRAMVKPLTGATGHFTKAAKYTDAGALTADSYVESLVTQATSPVAQQKTSTSLAVSDTHDLTDGTVAEFEGQEVTLTATVTLSGSSTTKVTTGEVYFYKVGSPNTLIGKANVQSDGTAVLEATMSTYSTGASDVFKAVYQENATYETSTSSNESVLIRSTAIAWAGSKVLTVSPAGSIYADNQYTLALPSNGIVEDGQSSVILAVGTDYVVSWYMVKADGTEELLAENTQSNTYTVVPPTAGVKFYAVVSPKGNYTDAYENGATKNFLTSDKTDASVKAPTITTITFGDVKTDTGKTPDFSQYEEKTITITAKVVEGQLDAPTTAKTPEEVVKSGTVTFYVVTAEGTNKEIGTAAVDSSGQATVSYTLPAYALSDGLSNIEYFFAMYTDTVGTYADSNTTTESSSSITAPLTHYFGVGTDTKIDKEAEAVQILSTTISWKIDSTNKIVADPDANKLKVYTADANGNKGTEVSDGKMTAGSTYTLELPAVYALDDAAETAATALTVNKDYTVVWQYREFGASDWNNYPNASAGNTVLITPDYSGYQFQAVVTPVYDNDALTGYKTAAAYNASDVATGKTNSLVTDPTEKTELQATATDLAITGAVEEAANQVLFGETKFGWGNHLVQYENQTVTLKATVTDNATGLGVNSVGKVYFYRYTNDSVDNNDVLLNANGQGIEVGPDGIATMNYTMPAYDSTKVASAEENCSRIYAVYVEGVTYDTSASVSFTTDTLGVKTYGKPNSGLKNMAFSMSTTIKTPIIDSTRANADGKTATTYTADLTGLLAGVEHTFTLRTGASTADWSVVALDGRTVADTNYDIQWNVKTGDNTETSTTVGGTFTTTDNKIGDEISVTLIAKNDMKVDATSKKAIIGTKQDVNVTVTASDEIASTTDTDVYQLNEITLTATVAAKETNATVKPTGTVAFYYKDGTNWVYLDEAVLTKDTDGQMRASITTDKLPVTGGTNVKRDVEITAVYLGDETFKVSGNYTESTRTVTAGTGATGNGVTDETVTVYSSVVLVHAAEENKAVTSLTDGGIHISAEDGKVLANETRVNLKLSDVFTLDYNNATVGTVDLSKLAYGTEADYTVQWQKLSNAASYASDYADEEVPWQPITSANGTICQITVEQGAAYRAMITVNNTPIAKGSYTSVHQVIDGRQVYYSNILVAANAPATVTVNVNTDKTGAGFEGIVEGETVTIHTFASGASGTTPISELTVTITDASGAEVDKQVKTNVNGHVSFDWTAADPGYYTLTVNAKFTNGYSEKEITRTLIVRDNDYGFTAAGDNTTYNGKVQGLTVTVDNMGIEEALAQKSVVVYYYDKDGKQVEPTQAGTYKAVIRLQESAYWTEKTMDTTFTIKQREVSVVDLIAQAKVYDGTTNANIQEIILNDAETAQTSSGLPTGTTGIINGDSVYAVGTGYTAAATAGATTLGVKEVELKGDDAANYKLVDATYTEAFNIQRSQVKGVIADSTYKYTGSNITVPADDIYLIDQAGNVLTPADYTVTYYYHNGDGVEKVTAMNKLGKYTVIARPEQSNYKGGASQVVYVAATADDQAPDTTAKSALIDITNTVELFGAAANTGIVATATNGATTTVNYYVSGSWTATVPTAAGRYLVKVTASTGDTAYGIYTIVKANPALTLTAANQEYNSAPYAGTVSGTWNNEAFPTGTYFTYAGGTIQGVAYEAPTEVGTYIVTAHVPETADYTAHEISAQFVITPKALEITADSLQRRQYGAFPDMTASFDGLAGSAYAPDTSLRDVQIQPELIFNTAYSNDAMDQVGNNYSITPVAALARNYDVSYVNGNLSVTRDEPNPYLAIHGMIDNGNGGDIAYYGDVIQLYAYGSQSETGVINNSSVLTWSSSDNTKFPVTQDGLLKINGVGTFTVTLTRGVGAQKISTSITITALKQEVKVVVPELNTVYNAAPQDYTTTKTMSAVNAKGVQVFVGNSRFVISGYTRTEVGSQIVTGKVADSIQSFQSETYGGLFTINDKEVTVKPDAASVVYGAALGTLTYTEEGIVTGTPALTNGKAVSIRDTYVNLDVLDGYEILVAGVENMNYNVKYITDQTAPDAEVTAKPLTVSTGTLDANVGMTSGSLNPVGKYPVDGAEVNASATLGASNVRMYGEPNWVMDYALTSLIPGDSLADLALDPLAGNLVDFNYTIAANANITYPTRTSTTPTYIGSLTAYPVDTGASMIAFGNYNETYTKGTQNIYQRPVKLELSNGTDTLDVLFSDVNSLTVDQRTAYLRNLIVANLNVLKYTEAGQEVGGLATLLKHTANDLDYELTYTYDATGFDVTIKAINNYWSENYTIHVNVVKEKYRVVYNSFTATSATVTLYHVDLDTGAETAEFLPSGELMCKIFIRTADDSYLGETPVVNVAMQRTSTPGVYTVTYPRLVGSYRMFAIAEGGVGYTIVNGIE